MIHKITVLSTKVHSDIAIRTSTPKSISTGNMLAPWTESTLPSPVNELHNFFIHGLQFTKYQASHYISMEVHSIL